MGASMGVGGKQLYFCQKSQPYSSLHFTANKKLRKRHNLNGRILNDITKINRQLRTWLYKEIMR